MLRTILISAATLTLAAATPAMAQSTTGDSYTTMPPPASYDEPMSDDGYVDIPGTNHRTLPISSSANGSASSAGTAGTSGGSAGTGSTGGGAASARR